MNKKDKKILIGWQEWISLPDLGIPAMKVKVDTGAKTSSLHAENIEYFLKNGKNYIRFDVLPLEKDDSTVIKCEAPLFEKRNVKSSTGHKERRPVILTTLTVGGESWEIQLNLTKRNYMNLHMLLGRNAMADKISIDPGKKFLTQDYSKKEIEKFYNNNEIIK